MKAFYRIFIFLLFPSILLSHGKEVHNKSQEIEPKQVIVKKSQKDIYGIINQNYITNVKPIFEKKCFNCHSNKPSYPFYYPVPGIKQLIDYDIKEARSHINMSNDFPFISHDTPINDLKSIKKSTIENSMPPLRYIIAHWDTRLKEEDKNKIIKWIDESLKILKK